MTDCDASCGRTGEYLEPPKITRELLPLFILSFGSPRMSGIVTNNCQNLADAVHAELGSRPRCALLGLNVRALSFTFYSSSAPKDWTTGHTRLQCSAAHLTYKSCPAQVIQMVRISSAITTKLAGKSERAALVSSLKVSLRVFYCSFLYTFISP